MNNPCSNICLQAFPPANAIFLGIGVLLSVGILHDSLVQPILILMAPRRSKMPALTRTSSSISSIALNVSFAGLRYTLGSRRLWL